MDFFIILYIYFGFFFRVYRYQLYFLTGLCIFVLKNRQKVRKTVTWDRLSQSLHRKVTSTKKPILLHMGFLIYFTVIQTCPSWYQENRSRKLRHIVFGRYFLFWFQKKTCEKLRSSSIYYKPSWFTQTVIVPLPLKGSMNVIRTTIKRSLKQENSQYRDGQKPSWGYLCHTLGKTYGGSNSP